MPNFGVHIRNGALGSVKHTVSVKCVQVDRKWPNMSPGQLDTVESQLDVAEDSVEREAGQPPAMRTRHGAQRLPRRTAKANPALHGGTLHLGPERPYRQSRREILSALVYWMHGE
ncbi:hypothetical protein BSIN_0609 [Burkholderia singularis]|uniref:Uncharacterized protein n=1 Tax=Burkholderia singularis TaxID=1503053 RepID=A0A238H8J6_9BURK|nr:hypothetical protein BSIN_0609 [Burkholderia singularis]